MSLDSIIDLDHFYAYGHGGRAMIAVRAPFAMSGDGAALVGKVARIGGVCYEILAIGRQISGPIAVGEPIGVEVRPVSTGFAG